MPSAHATAHELFAPERLGLETRVEFRSSAIEQLDRLPEDTGTLIVDLSRTRHVDSAGLGALMLIQRRAAERRQTVVLRHPSDELRFLLVITKLAELFQLEPPREARGNARTMDGPGGRR